MSEAEEGDESPKEGNKEVDKKVKPVIAALTAQGGFGSSWTGIPFNYIVAKPKK